MGHPFCRGNISRPNVNGDVVCQTMRNSPEFESTRIIIGSGVLQQEEID
jgi:hypothetical protein